MSTKKKAAFVCAVNGIKIKDLDGLRCFFANFAAVLYEIKFGYICCGLLALIILISLFGSIQETYRWFILNQAIWDLLITYYYICDNSVQLVIYNYWDFRCIYNSDGYFWIYSFLLNCVRTNSYSALLLFSFTRFLCLYFLNFYDKLTNGRKIFYTIFGFNFVIIFVNINELFNYLVYLKYDDYVEVCIPLQKAKKLPIDECFDETCHDWICEAYSILYKIFSGLVFIKPILCLSLSIVAAFAIIFRVAKQAKFQFQHNRKDFMKSVRITLVIASQTLLNSIVFIVEVVANIQEILPSTFAIPLLTSSFLYSPELCTGCWDFRLPHWLDGDFGLASLTVRQAIVQFRVFVESLIVLLLMTGYREDIIKAMKWGFRVAAHPRQTYDNLKSGVSQSEVFTLT